MKCDICGKETYSSRKIDDKNACHTCYEKCRKCELCQEYVDKLQMINNKLACNCCYEIIYKLISDKRIAKLKSVSQLSDEIVHNNINDFEKLEREALSSALFQRNFEIIGLSTNATFDEVREKCKKLLMLWHPDLHKDDQGKYDLSLKKEAEIKNAYEIITAEIERPYKTLELRYGANLNEIMLSYDNLKAIYDPINFSDDEKLQKKVRFKREELTKAYEYLTRMQHGNKISIQKQSKPVEVTQSQQIASASKSIKPQQTSAVLDQARQELLASVKIKSDNTTSSRDAFSSPLLNMDKPSEKHDESKSSSGIGGRLIKIICTVLTVFGLLIVMVFAKGIGKMAGNSFNQGKIEGAIEKELLETSKQVNAQLPMMIDKETQLDATICAGKQLQYKYTMINMVEKDIDKVGFQNELKTMLIANQCSTENTLKLLKVGVKYNYMYLDKYGKMLATINISKSDCGL